MSYLSFTLFFDGRCHLSNVASNGALRTLFSSENSLSVQLWKKNQFFLYYYLINIANTRILSLNFLSKIHSAPLQLL